MWFCETPHRRLLFIHSCLRKDLETTRRSLSLCQLRVCASVTLQHRSLPGSGQVCCVGSDLSRYWSGPELISIITVWKVLRSGFNIHGTVSVRTSVCANASMQLVDAGVSFHIISHKGQVNTLQHSVGKKGTDNSPRVRAVSRRQRRPSFEKWIEYCAWLLTSPRKSVLQRQVRLD